MGCFNISCLASNTSIMGGDDVYILLIHNNQQYEQYAQSSTQINEFKGIFLTPHRNWWPISPLIPGVYDDYGSVQLDSLPNDYHIIQALEQYFSLPFKDILGYANNEYNFNEHAGQWNYRPCPRINKDLDYYKVNLLQHMGMAIFHRSFVDHITPTYNMKSEVHKTFENWLKKIDTYKQNHNVSELTTKDVISLYGEYKSSPDIRSLSKYTDTSFHNIFIYHEQSEVENYIEWGSLLFNLLLTFQETGRVLRPVNYMGQWGDNNNACFKYNKLVWHWTQKLESERQWDENGFPLPKTKNNTWYQL